MARRHVSSLQYTDAFPAHFSDSGLINKVALRHYIDFFDFTDLRLDNAFRYVL